MKKRIIIAGLGLAALTLIGAGCAGTEVAETTNDSIEAENTNVVADVEVLDEGTGNNENSDGEVVSNVNEEDVEVAGDSEIDMSDWLTYRNEEYGLEFEYPKDWTVKDLSPGRNTTGSTTLLELVVRRPGLFNDSDVYISITTKPADEFTFVNPNSNSELLSEKNGMLGSLSGKLIAKQNKTNGVIGTTFVSSYRDGAIFVGFHNEIIEPKYIANTIRIVE